MYSGYANEKASSENEEAGSLENRHGAATALFSRSLDIQCSLPAKPENSIYRGQMRPPMDGILTSRSSLL